MAAGILDQVSFKKETTAGVAVTPDLSIPVLASDGITIEQEPTGVQGINTQPALNKGFVPGLRTYTGAYDTNLYPQTLGYLLLSALGDVDSAVVNGETVVYAHTFTESATKPSLTVEQKTGDITNRFAGFVVSGLSFSMDTKKVKLSVSGNALSHASATAITYAGEDNVVFDWTDIQSITLGGTDIKAGITKLTLDYTNALETVHTLNGQLPKALVPGTSEVTGTIEGYLDTTNTNLLTLFTATTEGALVITLEGDETIGSSDKNSLVLTLPKVVLTGMADPVDTGYVKFNAKFAAREDATSGLISAVLTNTLASY